MKTIQFITMRVTEHPVFQNFWYPVLPAVDLQDEPVAFELLGQRLVLWRDGTGQVAVMRDRCCHRTAQLSRGKVVDGNLRCPYHGWQFNAKGICVQVPQLADMPIPASYRVSAYPSAERYGYLWVCLGEPIAPLPEIPEAEQPGFRVIPEFYEMWHCSGLRLMENSFDNAHLSFVHAATFGLQQEPAPADSEITELADGFQFQSVVPVANSPLQQQNLGMTSDRTHRILNSRWFLPFTRKLHITYPNGLIHIIVTAATPIHDSSSQIVQFCIRNDQESDAKAADIIAFDRAVTLEDRAILETTDWDTPLALDAEQHMPSDKPGIIMRHKLAALIRQHSHS
ncbi:MAG: aromatic ring-hydroxylating dioxygenase subunit alpha [Oculatellaceae cyanobacterium Prado106]|nr:aromatic ring-hydroxylating dioxygenase subunit alpha [Oculatellaceae cyanobacterium Prado106]